MKIRTLRVSGAHYEFGAAIGSHFSERIHAAYDSYALLRDMRVYHATEAGRARYEALLALHEAEYPQYLQELRGMAAGAGRDFIDVFLLNMRGEYRGYLQERDEIRGCSDCSILTDEMALIGHNEDGAPAFREHLYFVQAQVLDRPGFTACCYPGFLPGNAFGFNDAGICYSVDNLIPRDIRVGLGRQFLARSLLEAQSLDDAIARVTRPGRASGFSYTIGSVSERRIIQVEAMPQESQVTEIRGLNFHANHALEVRQRAQTVTPSSACRVARAEALISARTVTNAADILAILGDEADSEYPIYRTATGPDPNETYCTALFDLDAPSLSVYSGHPLREPGALSVFPM